MNATVDELIVISNTIGIYLSFFLFMSPGTC